MAKIPIGTIAAILNCSISQAKRKLKKIEQSGYVEFEDFAEWVENRKYNNNKEDPTYLYYIKILQKLDERMVSDLTKGGN